MQHRYDCYIIYHKEHRVYASICLFSLSIAPHYTVITVSFLSSILGSDLVYARSFSSSYYTERTSSTTLNSTKNSNRKYEISANNFHNLFGAQNNKHHPGFFLNHSAMPTDNDNNGRTFCPLSSFFIISLIR